LIQREFQCQNRASFNQKKNQEVSEQASSTQSTCVSDSSSTASYEKKYKTEVPYFSPFLTFSFLQICRNFELTGKCKFGDNCSFAHGDNELLKKKHVPSKYKTKLCNQYHTHMYCPYGLRCQFVHSLRAFNQPEDSTGKV
jgi:butyrate response factor 1